MKRSVRFLPLGSIPMLLAAVAMAVAQVHQPMFPSLLQKGYQSFMSVLMLLMQF